MEEIRIIVADDQPVVRDGLTVILNMHKPFRVVATTADGQETVQAARDCHPHVVLMDIHMPVMNGLRATKQIKELFPEVCIIMLTTFRDDEYIMEAIKLGASSYLLKDMDTDKLIQAVQDCLNGQMSVPLSIREKLSETIAESSDKLAFSTNGDTSTRLMDSRVDVWEQLGIHFTEREKQFIRLLMEGRSNQEMAAELFLTAGTVKNYISTLYRKLMVKNRAEAIALLHKKMK